MILCQIWAFIRLSQRLYEHRRALENNYHKNQHLQNAYKKYGNVFEIEVLEYCDNELKLDDLERFYIAYYDSMNPKKGYNKESGGNLNKHPSEEAKKKISEAQKGKHLSEETKKKISKNSARYWQGKTLSDEHKTKLSKAKQNIILPEEHKKNISRANNHTGFYRVDKQKSNFCRQGFSWRYRYYKDKRYHPIYSINLLKLKEKVEAQGLPWEIIDEEKAKKSLELNNKYHKGEKND